MPDSQRLNQRLLAVIEQQRAQSSGVQRSNLGGWHSDTQMTDWGGGAAAALAEFAAGLGGAHMADIDPAGKRDFRWAVTMWANINGPGNANQAHCHPGAFWSGVYYVDTGGAESGELLLEDPRYPMAYMGVPNLVLKDVTGSPMQSQTVVSPEAGMLVLFPSWLRHSVRPHRGNTDRVSVALNLTPVPTGPVLT